MKLSKKELKRKISNICDLLYSEYCEKLTEKEDKDDICMSKHYVNFGDCKPYAFIIYGTSEFDYNLKIEYGARTYIVISNEFVGFYDNTVADAAWRLFYLRIKNVK